MAQNFEQTEWLNLVDVSGPFLAGKVLEETFPQGLDKIETPRRQHLRAAYDEWDEARDQADPELLALHGAWVRLVLEQALEFESEVLTDRAKGGAVPSYEALAQGEAYSPDFVLRSLQGELLLFVSVYPPGTDLEQPLSRDWVASPIERMTLLCRSEKVRIGLVTNGEEWSLVNAPEGETSGYATWLARLWWLEPVTFKAFVSLLGVRRFFGPAAERLDSLLQRSLSEHHEVTDTLGQQVRRAVEVLVQALGRADEDRDGELLRGVAPSDLYNAGLTVMMRLVFLLCAEERELLLSGDPVYDQHYAISTLRAKLHEESDQHGVEVLERRYDAWSRLLSMFRVVYGGIEHESLRMPAMGGSLFDPDRFPFLEGRARRTSWRTDPASPLPIDNRTVMLLLQALQVLEHRGGARQLSYRGLDVEQIGHVYEGLLEYKVERVPVVTLGILGSKEIVRPTIALRQVEALAGAGVTKAAKGLADLTGRSVATLAKALQRQPVPSELPPLVHACGGDEALARRILPFSALLAADSWGVPLIYRAGSFAVTLGSGRRESGAHYTPKALTEPIVATTLRPILEAMGEHPSPDKLLALKVCDPAMGSGAFLVEACRQLGAQLVEAWTHAERAGHSINVHGEVVEGKGGQELLSTALSDRVVTARRLVSDRCLYGVDKNPMAVELAKLSLWLVSLAKGRPLGFLDHKLKHGDSLVGLTKTQIGAFHWNPAEFEFGPLFRGVTATVDAMSGWRREIQALDEGDYDRRRMAWEEAEDVVHDVRLIGDLCVAAYFGAEKDKDREALRLEYRRLVEAWKADGERMEIERIVAELRGGDRPVPPFHWEIEFPEVFDRSSIGFDVVVGNPPFAGHVTFAQSTGQVYTEYLRNRHAGTAGKCDLVAHFFRRAFDILRENGTFGLVATNSIAQGATRRSGLEWIVQNGGGLYAATQRLKWPGSAAVTVAIVHLVRGPAGDGPFQLGGALVSRISSFLLSAGPDTMPFKLAQNEGHLVQGNVLRGNGFTFCDTDEAATPLSEMHRLLEMEPDSNPLVLPYVGGRELNDDPQHQSHRFVIDFGDMSVAEAKRHVGLFSLVEARVRPQREALPLAHSARKTWWQFGHGAKALREARLRLSRVLCRSFISSHHAFTWIPARTVLSHNCGAYVRDDLDASFAVLQARPHELFAAFFSSSLEDRQGYRPSDCFDTYPFPTEWGHSECLASASRAYVDYRAALMIRNAEGLTKTYNRFHDPDKRDPDVLRLRELHAAMDRVVLDAYGWKDISTECDFFLDHEIEEETWGDKKKPYRYRWPDAVRDEVLARLLELNQQRYQEEVAAGQHGDSAKKAIAPSQRESPPAVVPTRPSPVPKPAVAPPPANLLQLGTAELVALGTPEARRELVRRGRDPLTGKKSAQGKLF